MRRLKVRQASNLAKRSVQTSLRFASLCSAQAGWKHCPTFSGSPRLHRSAPSPNGLWTEHETTDGRRFTRIRRTGGEIVAPFRQLPTSNSYLPPAFCLPPVPCPLSPVSCFLFPSAIGLLLFSLLDPVVGAVDGRDDFSPSDFRDVTALLLQLHFRNGVQKVALA